MAELLQTERTYVKDLEMCIDVSMLCQISLELNILFVCIWKIYLHNFHFQYSRLMEKELWKELVSVYLFLKKRGVSFIQPAVVFLIIYEHTFFLYLLCPFTRYWIFWWHCESIHCYVGWTRLALNRTNLGPKISCLLWQFCSASQNVRIRTTDLISPRFAQFCDYLIRFVPNLTSLTSIVDNDTHVKIYHIYPIYIFNQTLPLLSLLTICISIDKLFVKTKFIIFKWSFINSTFFNLEEILFRDELNLI